MKRFPNFEVGDNSRKFLSTVNRDTERDGKNLSTRAKGRKPPPKTWIYLKGK